MKKHPDYLFLFFLAILVFFGIIMVFSSSGPLALKNTGDGFYYVKRHIFYVVLGLFAFYFALNLNLSQLRKRSFFLLLGAFLLSLAVFVPGVGKTMGGATRWISILGISLQPAELLKVAIIVFLSHLIARGKQNPFLLLFLSVTFVIPVLLQPDFGSSLTILITVFLMLFVVGIRLSHLVYILFSGAAAGIALSITSPYRMKRLISFRNPWADPTGAGYQIIQSHIAVSSGHIFGLGLGNSKQKFLYLPQQYADFIFAIMCEEVGLIGAGIFLILLILFLIRGLIVSSWASDPFLSFLGGGIILMFSVQAFINIAVVLGLVPTTGLPLPFISYGGTSLVVNLFSAGIVANISRK